MPIKLKKSKVFDSMMLTPFIDIMMFLLLAMLVASDLNQGSQKELPIRLPSVRGAVPMVSEPNKIEIGIHADGRYVVDEVAVSRSSVEEIIAQAVIDNPTNHQVIIHADRDAKYQSVATIIDICNRGKVASYRVLVTEESTGV
jgi:biopolymer transport protein ExbD